MLQRIQTVLLLGVVGCMGAYCFLPIWEKVSQDGVQKMTLNAMGFKTWTANNADGWDLLSHEYPYLILIASCLVIGVVFYSIFRYDNRLTQIKLGALIALLIMVAVGLSVIILLKNEMNFNAGTKGNYLVGFFIPLGALILNSLANRFIRKDEKLIRSVDRIR